MVDDDESIRAATVALLRREGYEVRAAASAEDALVALGQTRFCLLITDLNMGAKSGLDLAREARGVDRDLAVLMLTGVDDTAVAQQALALGVFGYMIKPIQLNEMRIAVMNALRRRELEIATRQQVLGLEAAVRARTAELAIRESRFRSLANSSPMGIIYGDPAGKCEYANREASSIFGCAPEDLGGHGWFARVHPDDRAGVSAAIGAAVHGVLKSPSEHRLVQQDGRMVWVNLHVAPITSEDSQLAGFVALVENIGPRKQLEARLQHLATHDHLTGLANRRWLEARLEYVLSSLPPRAGLGVAIVDLDQFKLVNDTYGHAAGDELIVRVAERLRRLAGPDDEVARFGGDEFVVLVRREGGPDDVRHAVRELHAALGGRIALREADVYLGASIGVAITSDGSVSAAVLLRDADIAMHHAKDRGRGAVEEFDERLRAAVRRRLDLATELRETLESGGLDVAYQPQFDTRTGDLRGFEALARWTRANGEIVGPAEFIPVAEAAGLVHHVDRAILDVASMQLAAWQQEGRLRRAVTMSVNLSARQLSDSHLLNVVQATVARSGIDPGALILEVTESVVMTDVMRSHRILEELRNLGVKIAIDDFGTGYSSLSYLRQLPVDYLKIDQSFVDTLSRHPIRDRDRGLVAAVIDLAHHFGLTVVAEGVEDEYQLGELRAMGCDLVQGFLFARPAAAGDEALRQLMRSGGGPVRAAETPAVDAATQTAATPRDSAGQAAVEARRLVVLIADDEIVQRTAYRRALERAGATVVEANSGGEALALVAQRHIDAALVDNHMPGISGLEFLAQIRADPATAHLPVVLATGTSYGQEIDRARELGVSNWLLKPVDLDELVRLVIAASLASTAVGS